LLKRGERIAQLVGQRGEEFVLAPIRFREIGGQPAKVVFHVPPLGDVLADGRERDGAPRLVIELQHFVSHPARCPS
jgi:hypothetical protein